MLITAAMLGLDAQLGRAPTLALTTTTERWLDDWELRETTHQFVRAVRSEVGPFEYAWLREWTTGLAATSGGIRRTHYHWPLKDVPVEAAEAIVAVAQRVWKRRAGAHEHQAQPMWDAAGFGRYVAGLVGHHLIKESQAPPPGWRGRRLATSRGYYNRPAAELRARAEVAVREERLIRRIEAEVVSGRDWPDVIQGPWLDWLEDELEDAYVRAIREPAPVVVKVAYDYWERDRAAVVA